MMRQNERLKPVEIRSHGETHEQIVIAWLTPVSSRKGSGQRPDFVSEIRTIPAPCVEHVGNEGVVELSRVLHVDSVAPTVLMNQDLGARQLLLKQKVAKAGGCLMRVGCIHGSRVRIHVCLRPLHQCVVLFDELYGRCKCDRLAEQTLPVAERELLSKRGATLRINICSRQLRARSTLPTDCPSTAKSTTNLVPKRGLQIRVGYSHRRASGASKRNDSRTTTASELPRRIGLHS